MIGIMNIVAIDKILFSCIAKSIDVHKPIIITNVFSKICIFFLIEFFLQYFMYVQIKVENMIIKLANVYRLFNLTAKIQRGKTITNETNVQKRIRELILIILSKKFFI